MPPLWGVLKALSSFFPAGASVMAPPLSAPRHPSWTRRVERETSSRSRGNVALGGSSTYQALCAPWVGMNLRHKKPSMASVIESFSTCRFNVLSLTESVFPSQFRVSTVVPSQYLRVSTR